MSCGLESDTVYDGGRAVYDGGRVDRIGPARACTSFRCRTLALTYNFANFSCRTKTMLGEEMK